MTPLPQLHPHCFLFTRLLKLPPLPHRGGSGTPTTGAPHRQLGWPWRILLLLWSALENLFLSFFFLRARGNEN